jgi:hypothetical protein
VMKPERGGTAVSEVLPSGRLIPHPLSLGRGGWG